MTTVIYDPDQDYYEILEVDPDASKLDIQNNYRRLARLWHPDANKSSGAEEYFKLINLAYDVLNDNEKRQEYDTLRNSYLSGQPPVIRLSTSFVDFGEVVEGEIVGSFDVNIYNDGGEASFCEVEPQEGDFWSIALGIAEDDEAYGLLRISLNLDEYSTAGAQEDRIKVALDNGNVAAAQWLTIRANLPELAVSTDDPSTASIGITSAPSKPRLPLVFKRAAAAFILAWALLLLMLSLSSKHTSNSLPPTTTSTTADTADLSNMRLINARINQLTLMCIVQPICKTFPLQEGALPVFVNGMDFGLMESLNARHYGDEWVDNYGQKMSDFNGGPVPLDDEPTFSFVNNIKPYQITNSSSGMILGRLKYAFDGFPSPDIGVGAGTWTITWELIDPSGTIVKALHFSVVTYNPGGCLSTNNCVFPNLGYQNYELYLNSNMFGGCDCSDEEFNTYKNAPNPYANYSPLPQFQNLPVKS